MPRLRSAALLAALALAGPLALLLLEALRVGGAWDAWASPAPRVVLALLAAGSVAAVVGLLARRPAPGADVAEARALHDEAVRALQEAARLLAQAPAPAPPERPLRRAWWGAGVALAFLVACGALWTLAAPAAPTSENVHEHARFALYVDGERVEYSGEAFDLAQRGFLRGHLHAPDGETIHVEGRPGLTLGEFFERTLEARLEPGRVTLHDGRAFDAPVRLYVGGASGGWREAWDAAAFEPRDGHRLLVVVGGPPAALPAWAADADLLRPPSRPAP